MDYQKKYIKYKEKYIALKKQIGGEKKNIAVYIGRFQPLHNAHLMTILKALREEDHLILYIGSAGRPEKLLSEGKIDPKNPYTTPIRTAFIEESIRMIKPELLKKLSIIPIPDSWPDNAKWFQDINDPIITYIKNKYGEELSSSIEKIRENFNIFLYGSGKDKSTIAYLKLITEGVKIYGESYLIPKFIEPEVKPGAAGAAGAEGPVGTLDATEIRQIIDKIKKNEADKKDLIERLKTMVPEGVLRVLRDVENF